MRGWKVYRCMRCLGKVMLAQKRAECWCPHCGRKRTLVVQPEPPIIKRKIKVVEEEQNRV